MLHEMKLVLDEDKEELAYLNGQEKIVGQTPRAIIMMENQNSIMIENEEIVSQNDCLGDIE